ncbi:hypothetical protein APSETT445_008507 [Aspergillus pseudonomiae]
MAGIARAIATSGPDANGDIVKQNLSYHSGVGTGGLPFQKAIYGGIGWGLGVDICRIYDFISNNYVPGDELFFFGFSRGASTVRLVCDIGIHFAVHMSHFAEMWRAYRENTDGEPFNKTARYQQNKDKLRLIDDLRSKLLGLGTQLELWTPDSPAKDLQQCWLPGAHGNIGGQEEDPRAAGDHEEIGYITLAWMKLSLVPQYTTYKVDWNEIDQQFQRMWETATTAAQKKNIRTVPTDGLGLGQHSFGS